MKDKYFNIILYTLLTIGIISVLFLIVYTFILYKDCSIISYIGNGK